MAGVIAYAKFYYSHFYTAHVRYHHKTVATFEDATTARMNESVIAFFIRGIPGKMIEAWNFNSHKRHSWLSLQNEMLKHLALYIAIFSGITFIFGLRAGIFSLTQGAFCALMIEIVNYVEHYGLERKQDLSNGFYEPVNLRHSWNAP